MLAIAGLLFGAEDAFFVLFNDLFQFLSDFLLINLGVCQVHLKLLQPTPTDPVDLPLSIKSASGCNRCEDGGYAG